MTKKEISEVASPEQSQSVETVSGDQASAETSKAKDLLAKTGPAEPDPKKTRLKSSSPASATGALILAIVALTLSLGLLAAVYFTWDQLQQLVQVQSTIDQRMDRQLDERVQPLRGSVESMSRKLEAQTLQLEDRVGTLAQAQQDYTHRLSVLSSMVGRSEQGWKLAEIEYLLRIANQRLQLQHDIGTAILALKTADERLYTLADPHYQTVREQIAREIKTLQAVPLVDVNGLIAELDAWQKRVDELPISGAQYQPVYEDKPKPVKDKASAADWRELPALILESVAGLFRLREHKQHVIPMLAPPQEYFLRENVRLQLAAARLALLRKDVIQFQYALHTASRWLDDYFSAENKSVKELSDALKQFLTLELDPDVPDLSVSLRLLRKQLASVLTEISVPATDVIVDDESLKEPTP